MNALAIINRKGEPSLKEHDSVCEASGSRYPLKAFMLSVNMLSVCCCERLSANRQIFARTSLILHGALQTFALALNHAAGPNTCSWHFEPEPNTETDIETRLSTYGELKSATVAPNFHRKSQASKASAYVNVSIGYCNYCYRYILFTHQWYLQIFHQNIPFKG